MLRRATEQELGEGARLLVRVIGLDLAQHGGAVATEAAEPGERGPGALFVHGARRARQAA